MVPRKGCDSPSFPRKFPFLSFSMKKYLEAQIPGSNFYSGLGNITTNSLRERGNAQNTS